MTDDQIIAVAKAVRNGGHWDQLDIINFGRLIAAAEREECAKVCEQSDDDGEGPDCWFWHSKDYAKAIRARGQK